LDKCPFIENNVRQGFVKHFQNLNLKLARVGNHRHIEPKDMYHERVRIPYRLREQIWKKNRVEMRAQTMVDVVPISIALIPSLLHQNNIGVTYVRPSNFIMELVISMPLYYVVMPYFIIIIIEASFILTLIHTIDGVRSRPQTPRGTKFVSLHEDIPRKVNEIFASQPLDLGSGGSNPLGSLGPSRPPRPP
jgi:hypothetical protein